DLTAHVDFTWLACAAGHAGMREVGLTTQSEFLTQLGLGEWLIDLQHQPDVALDEYLRAQGAVYRLIEPGGLGRFRVLGLAKDMGDDPSLMGFRPMHLRSTIDTSQRDPRTAERKLRFG